MLFLQQYVVVLIPGREEGRRPQARAPLQLSKGHQHQPVQQGLRAVHGGAHVHL
jgi:hypothetical protein